MWARQSLQRHNGAGVNKCRGSPISLWLPLVYVTLSCTFRYGRDDMDVMGISFRRDIFMSTRQVYPPLQDKEQTIMTKMQEKILKKLGDNAYPFFFEVSTIKAKISGIILRIESDSVTTMTHWHCATHWQTTHPLLLKYESVKVQMVSIHRVQCTFLRSRKNLTT